MLPEAYQLPTIRFKVLRLEEIIAEKVHAIYKRPQPRDLYDPAYLLEHGVEFDWDSIAAKLESYGRAFEPATFKTKVARLEPRWTRDREGLLARPTTYTQMATSVLVPLEKQT